jgi:hypothetical protein
VGHEVCIGGGRNAKRISVGKPEGRNHLRKKK